MAKGRIIIDVDRCKGCALCTSYCPVHILELDNKKQKVKGDTIYTETASGWDILNGVILVASIITFIVLFIMFLR